MRKRLTAMLVLMMLVFATVSESAQAAFISEYTTTEGMGYSYSGGWVTRGKKTYFTLSSGVNLTGMQIVDGKQYFFNASGVLQKGGWVTFEGSQYYAAKNGVIQKNVWINRTWYVTSTGEQARGFHEINGNLYFFALKNGKVKKDAKFKINGAAYYANKFGVVIRSHFVNIGDSRFFAQEDGTLASGLTQIGKHLYFFKLKSHKMIRDKKKRINGAYYYFQQNGRAARNKWVKIKSKYYYFLEDGTMAVNQFIGSGWYVGPDGARTKKSMKAGGVTKLNGKYYLYDKSGVLVTNKWVTIGTKTYYAGPDGAALSGLQKINGKKYYFNKRGVLQKDTVVTIGDTVYVIGSDGRITGTAQYSGEAIAEYGKKFVGNPYVYGGTSLTNGADCSGFVYSIMLKFGIRVLRTADQQMKGPSSAEQKQGYKKGIVVKDSNLQPGDLVFYGNSSYASHVAIYIGNGKVVHAANSRVGIIISGIDYCSGRVKNRSMRYWA